MPSGIPGNEIRAIRNALGLSIEQFSRVLGVHAVTLNRWELAGPACPVIEGMAWNVLVGLRQRLVTTNAPKAAAKEAATAGQEIEQLLVVGGVLVALAALLAFISG